MWKRKPNIYIYILYCLAAEEKPYTFIYLYRPLHTLIQCGRIIYGRHNKTGAVEFCGAFRRARGAFVRRNRFVKTIAEGTRRDDDGGGGERYSCVRLIKYNII